MVQPVPLCPRRPGAAGGELTHGRGPSEGLAAAGVLWFYICTSWLKSPGLSTTPPTGVPHAVPSPASAHTVPHGRRPAHHGAPPRFVPVLGVVLLLSSASFSHGGANSSGSKVDVNEEPISGFSTSIFVLVTAIRLLRELAAHVAALKEQVRPLGAAVKALVERDEGVRRGVWRVERRVRKLKSAAENASAAEKASLPEASGSNGTACKTIFVPAPSKPRAPSPLSLGANGKRRALDSIPEESEVFTFPTPLPPGVQEHHLGVVELLRQFLATGLALVLYPLYLVLLPVRRFVLVGA
ncbi:hypothetical protein C8R45DRAFT_1221795 [Mycena sanguinolenta]|nr:hypothetical protein C8R45DRAFT_1221795 [Mycena sanguinolenta]